MFLYGPAGERLIQITRWRGFYIKQANIGRYPPNPFNSEASQRLWILSAIIPHRERFSRGSLND